MQILATIDFASRASPISKPSRKISATLSLILQAPSALLWTSLPGELLAVSQTAIRHNRGVSSFPLLTLSSNGADRGGLGDSSTSPIALLSKAFNRIMEQMDW